MEYRWHSESTHCPFLSLDYEHNTVHVAMLLDKQNLQNAHYNEDKTPSYQLGFWENKYAHECCTHFHMKMLYGSSSDKQTLLHSNDGSSDTQSKIYPKLNVMNTDTDPVGILCNSGWTFCGHCDPKVICNIIKKQCQTLYKWVGLCYQHIWPNQHF